MRKPLQQMLLTLAISLSSLPAFSTDTLTMGVFPYFDVARLAALHKPLKDYLAQQIGEEIRLVSAPSFKDFKQRTAKGQYDIIVTAPHLGRIAEKKAAYEWLGFTSNYSNAVFVSRKDSPIKSIADLKGKSLALPPKPAIIHHLAINQLEKNGLTPGKDVMISTLSSHNNAMLSAIRGDNDAAAFGRPTWLRYDAPVKESLRLIAISERIPGFAILVNSKLPKKTKLALRTALFAYENTKPGISYFYTTGLKGVRETTNADMQLLDHYLGKIASARKKHN